MEPVSDEATITSAAPKAAPPAGAPDGWRGFGRALRDLVFPPSCVHCGGLVEASPLRHVCSACEPLIVRVESPHCPCCGHPYFGETEGERLCVHCEGLKPEFGEGKTAVLFKGPARALVHALKYRHGLHVLEDVATLVAAHPEVGDFIRGSVLVPVPLHPRKQRERGYNQSQLLAETMAKAVGGEGTRVEELLCRVADTQTQTNLDREQRRANLKNAFALAPGAAITESQSYILIDDVFTTGSTLNACAGVLRRAGCLKVNVVTFGHG
jgi:ComF family protein